MTIAGMLLNIASYAIPQQPVQESDDLIANHKSNLDKSSLKKMYEDDIVKKERDAETLIADILDEARSHIGKRYVWATRGPKTFDCSGYVYYVFKQFGYELSPSSRHQYTLGTHIERKDVRKGDLVFFHSRRRPKGVGHVGIVYEVTEGSILFIHASIRGVRISELEGYYEKNLVGFRRVI